MNRYHFLVFVCMIVLGGKLSAQGGYVEYHSGGYDDYDDPDGYDDSEVIWVGPGVYYGVYFSTRPDFYAWRRRNLYYHRYYHYGYRRWHYHYYDRRYYGGRHYHRRRSRRYYRRERERRGEHRGRRGRR
ncbi:MAG: hypothetical protein SNF33_01185 [Candidatus Algichlamydia australiensis]|nr:hypothetical protein [Chlamydiales bacterium]